MGQTTSQSNEEQPWLDTKVTNPIGDPQGLALIAHGRLGGNQASFATTTLANHLRKVHHVRVITWNARGVGMSEGLREFTSVAAWTGTQNVEDYNVILEQAILEFYSDYPNARNCDLFICGHSAGAVYASTVRPPQHVTPVTIFKPAKYILLSYPVVPAPILGLHKTGWYFRALEGIVGGGGWEECLDEPRADVLTLMGSKEVEGIGKCYWIWAAILQSKRKVSQGSFRQVIVDGANHGWHDYGHCIGDEIERWIEEEIDCRVK